MSRRLLFAAEGGCSACSPGTAAKERGMAPSRKRLPIEPRRRRMDDLTPLAELEAAFLDHHRALGRSAKTIKHYRDTFASFHRYLSASGELTTSRALTAATMQAFATWLRATPTRGWRGKTERSAAAVHGALKDMKAFCRWLHAEGHLATPVRVPVPKLPQTLFPVLSDEEIGRLWHSRYLTSPSDQGVRNRALLALMFDTGMRLAEVAGLTLADLDLDNQLATVTGKGNKQRRGPASSGVAAY